MHPILFTIGNFPIGTYGVLIIIGFFIALWLGSRLARGIGLAPEVIFDLCFLAIFTGIIGGRLFFIFTELPNFFKDPISYIAARGGFVFLGGLITAVAATRLLSLGLHGHHRHRSARARRRALPVAGWLGRAVRDRRAVARAGPLQPYHRDGAAERSRPSH